MKRHLFASLACKKLYDGRSSIPGLYENHVCVKGTAGLI
jgi:hypothetical protein